jgi:hypothetical protein
MRLRYLFLLLPLMSISLSLHLSNSPPTTASKQQIDRPFFNLCYFQNTLDIFTAYCVRTIYQWWLPDSCFTEQHIKKPDVR